MQRQWVSSQDKTTILAQREARIRRLEDAFLQLRLRRAQLEASLLAKEVQAARERFSNALKKSPSSLSVVARAAQAAPMSLRPSLRRVWPTPPSSFVPENGSNF